MHISSLALIVLILSGSSIVKQGSDILFRECHLTTKMHGRLYFSTTLKSTTVLILSGGS